MPFFWNIFLPAKFPLLSYNKEHFTPEIDMVFLNNMQCLTVSQNVIPQFNL